MSQFDLTFETNEGVTVLPVMISPGDNDKLENPYMHFRYVLVLPRGATGVKSCKIIHKVFGEEVQHNFTFGIMPPPYNYDNVLFGYYAGAIVRLAEFLNQRFGHLRLTTKRAFFNPINLPKGLGKQTIYPSEDMLFFTCLLITLYHQNQQYINLK